MPVINVQSWVDALGDVGKEATPATFTAQVMASDVVGKVVPAVRVDGAEVQFPKLLVAQTGAASTVELARPPENCFLQLDVRSGERSLVRNVLFPDGDGPFDYDQMVDVDPTTFEPLQPVPPSAQQVLDQAGQARDDAQTAAGSAGAAATAAAESAASISKGEPGGVAALDSDGDATDAEGAKLLTVEAAAAVVSPLIDARASRFDIRDYGAVCDGQLATVSATAGSAVVTRASGSFSSSDVGKTIAVRGAGPVTSSLVTSTILAYGNDGVWLGTIQSVSGSTATLDSNATTTVAAADCVYGTPDDAAISAAQDAAAVAGGEVFFPGQVNTIVTQSLTVKDFVRWVGAGMDVSHVWILRDGLNWLVAPGSLLSGTVIQDFAIHCWAFFQTSGYSASIKPLNISNQRRAMVSRMAIYDSPATALPFDHAHDYTIIAFNLIMNPGRLGGAGYGPGSSGIGLGTSGTGDINPTLVIGNVIIGSQTATVQGKGNSGIFLEAQSGSYTTDTVGYRIVDNIVIGMPIGIGDDGSRGTIITGNTVVHCGQAISLNNGGVVGGHPGRDTIIAQNALLDSWGPGTYDGTGIRITTDRPTSSGRPNVNPTIRSLLRDNVITGGSKWAILLECDDLEIHGVTIRGNSIRENGLSGIRLAKAPGNSTDKVRWLAITDNQISNNGKSLVHGDDYGIFSSLKLYNARIQNNDVYNDGVGAPTQAGTIYLAGSVNQDGIVNGNATPNPDLLADAGLAAAAAMSGAALSDGVITSKTWALAGSGVWSYTGTAMKPSSGATTLALVDPSGLGVNAIYGAVHATVQALASSSPFIGVVARAADASNYLRWAIQPTTGMYRLNSYIGGTANTLYDSTVVAAVGDVIKMEIDDPYIRLYVNGILIQEVTAASTLSNLLGTKWGMIGGYTSDATTALVSVGWTNNYRD